MRADFNFLIILLTVTIGFLVIKFYASPKYIYKIQCRNFEILISLAMRKCYHFRYSQL